MVDSTVLVVSTSRATIATLISGLLTPKKKSIGTLVAHFDATARDTFSGMDAVAVVRFVIHICFAESKSKRWKTP